MMATGCYSTSVATGQYVEFDIGDGVLFSSLVSAVGQDTSLKEPDAKN